MDTPVTFGLEISKFDAEKRIVSGTATSAIKDRQGDLIPYDVAAAAFTQAADTMGVREMHQAKAVGRLDGWTGDEDAGRVYVDVYLSKSRDGEDALTKVKEGVLKAFSIGGRALDTSYDVEKTATIIKNLELTEISLVDVPANPDAMISVVKLADADVSKADSDTPMKTVAGEKHPASDFAYVGDAEKTDTWKLPIFDKSHVDNAVARLNQTEIPSDKVSSVKAKVRAAYRKYHPDNEIPDAIKSFERLPVVKEWSFSDLKNKLEAAVTDACEEEYGSECYPYVIDFGNDWVVYRCEGKYWRRGYGRSASGSVYLGTKVEEVVETTDFVPVNPQSSDSAQSNQPQEPEVVMGKDLTEFDVGIRVRKQLMERGIAVKVGDATEALTEVKSLLDESGDSEDARKRASAAIETAIEMVSKLKDEDDGGADDAGDDAPTDDAAAKAADPPVTKDADPDPAPAPSATTDPPATTAKSDDADADVAKAAPAPTQPAPDAPAPAGLVTAENLESTIRGVMQGLQAAPQPVSKDIYSELPEKVAGGENEALVKAVLDGDRKAAIEAADGDTKKVQDITMAVATEGLAQQMRQRMSA